MSEVSATVTRQMIADGLRQLGLREGAGVMVHSSLKSFGHVEGGPAAVIEAIMDVLTPRGTLMMPSFNHGAPFKEGGSGVFDVRNTPTTNGAIPECFWRRSGVIRSMHPTHSFAVWGANAVRYTQWHHRTRTMAPDSPLGSLGQEGGMGLLLGVRMGSNTYHHVVEMAMEAPCLAVRNESYPMILADGRRVEGRACGWRERACPITDYTRYEALMCERGAVREVHIGASRCRLFALKDCFDAAAKLLREGLDTFPPCSRCTIKPRVVPQTVATDYDSQRGCLRGDSPALGY